MKKVMVSALALAMGLGLCQVAQAGDPQVIDTGLTAIIDQVDTSVEDINAMTFNAAVNIDKIDASVQINGATNSSVDFDTAELANIIKTTGIAAYNTGTIEIAQGTLSVDKEFTGSLDASAGFDASKEIGFTSEDYNGFTKSTGADEFSMEQAASLDSSLAVNVAGSLDMAKTGLSGNIAAFNLAYNTAELNASVKVGAEGATNSLESMQISTTAIGAYNTGTVNLGFTGLSVK